MRKTILALILCGAASAQIPTDNLNEKVAELANAYTKFRDAHPDAQIVKRIENAIAFRMADGKYTALIGNAMSYVDPDTRDLTPIDVNLYQTDAGYRTTGSPITVRVIDGPMISGQATTEVDTYYKNPNTGTVIGYGIAVAPATYSGDSTTFTFTQGGIPWRIELGAFGWDLRGTVAASQGAKTYRFGYREVNMTLAPDANGNLATANGGYSISAPVMVRADGEKTACGGWQQNATGNVIGFTCDDTAFPPEAFPYVIDPTATFYGGYGDEDCAYYIRPNGTSAYTKYTCNVGVFTANAIVFDSGCCAWERYDDVGFLSFDTSAIPAGAVVTAATLNIRGAQNAIAANSGTKVYWYPYSRWPTTVAMATDGYGVLAATVNMALTGADWNAIPLNQNLGQIQKGAGAMTGIRFGPNGSTAATYGWMDYYGPRSVNGGQSSAAPYLTVTYTVGGPKLIIVNQ